MTDLNRGFRFFVGRGVVEEGKLPQVDLGPNLVRVSAAVEVVAAGLGAVVLLVAPALDLPTGDYDRAGCLSGQIYPPNVKCSCKAMPSRSCSDAFWAQSRFQKTS